MSSKISGCSVPGDIQHTRKVPQAASRARGMQKNGLVLLIAKLDRLARNVHFVSGLIESRVKFISLAVPEANDLTIHIMEASS